MIECVDEFAAPGLSRRGLLAGAASAVLLSACGKAIKPPPERVLFVGNSLIYYNDMPGQFAQLASMALGRRVEAEMLARGGAHISHHAKLGLVQRELSSGRYSALVLQEFGGGLSCSPGMLKFGFSCETSHAAHAELAEAARAAGARAVLLGVYRQHTGSAAELVAKEAELARQIGALHIGLGDFPQLLSMHSDWAWLDPEDGQHPGPDLSLLMALRTVRALYARAPRAGAIALALHDYRGRESPSLDRLASMQEVGAAMIERRLDAEEFAQRLRAAGLERPAVVR
ncbi:hypothetical protein [Aquimonas sp.]|jgi:hypothetical protein|uniref:hypothetical protein n=1 Tax=Aquimonas sp. TaxID=1872588 RepID=UPI0037BFEFC9